MGVADTFIPDQIRHHCPTVVLLKFLRPHCKTFKRKIWNYKLADYTKYRSLLTDSNLEEKINSTTNLDQNAKDITDTLTNIAEQAIPSKHITIRPKEHPWITCHIKNLIRKRKRNFKKTTNKNFWENTNSYAIASYLKLGNPNRTISTSLTASYQQKLQT